MRTYPIADQANTVFALEIEGVYVTISTVAKILDGVNEVASVQKRKSLSSSPDTHLRFLFRGRPMIVFEPYGDSSRYWIGPEDADTDHADVGAIDDAFKRYRVPIFAKLAGDIVSLRYLTAFRR